MESVGFIMLMFSDLLLNYLGTGLISGTVAGVAAGLVITILQESISRYNKWRDSWASRQINYINIIRYIDGTLLNYLTIGTTLEYMKQTLGSPQKYWSVEPYHYEESGESIEQPGYHTYIYGFMNGCVKVVSENNISIDLIIVQSSNKSIEMATKELFHIEKNIRLGQTLPTKKIFADLIDSNPYIYQDRYSRYYTFGIPWGRYESVYIGGDCFPWDLETDEQSQLVGDYEKLLADSPITFIAFSAHHLSGSDDHNQQDAFIYESEYLDFHHIGKTRMKRIYDVVVNKLSSVIYKFRSWTKNG